MKTQFKLLQVILFFQFLNANQSISSEKMLNAFTMGMDEKGLELALEIISNEKYSNQREFTLFTLSEYFFHISIKDNDFTAAQRAFTFYSKFNRDYPDSKKVKIALLRISFLNSIFPTLLISGEYLSELFSEFYAVGKLGDIGRAYAWTEDIKDISETKMLIDTESSFQVANKYYDTIILNHPNFSAYGYYMKILSYLNYSHLWNSEVFYNSVDINTAEAGGSYFNKVYTAVNDILNLLKKKHPNDNLTYDAHVMLASTVWNASSIEMSKRKKKKIVKALLEYVLNNDNDKLGYRFNIVKEFVIRNL